MTPRHDHTILKARPKTGFTLMEMLVVLVVIGLIAAVAVPQVMRMLGSARHKAAKIQLETVSQALNAYQLDMETYPATATGLKTLWEAGAESDAWNGPYVRDPAQLVDPWGRPLLYQSPGTGRREFNLGTLGADGVKGGKGDDADLTAK